MGGITDLEELIKSMQPNLQEGDWVFVSVPHLTEIDLNKVLGMFREEEGISLILPKSEADILQLGYDSFYACISLGIHSSLEAVGLTALISNTLASLGISCNVVAANYHDHIFVEKRNAERAMEALRQLTNTKEQTP